MTGKRSLKVPLKVEELKQANNKKEVSDHHRLSILKLHPYCIFILLIDPHLLSQDADQEKKKLEDRGKAEKEKRKYNKLVEDCKQKTEKHKIVLNEVVKAQKELILANSEVGCEAAMPSLKHFFEGECHDKAIL